MSRVCVTSTSYKPAFAWLPTRLTEEGWIWLRRYQSINGGKWKRLYAAPTDTGRE
jgi:hypothetical protein